MAPIPEIPIPPLRSVPKADPKPEAVARPVPRPEVKPAPKPRVEKVDKAKLGIKDIVDGVRKNAKLVTPCLKTARRAGELIPGKYKLILNWTILPNGSVTGSQLKGPSKILGTSLATCIPHAMRQWKFPSSDKGAPVKNFPFGPFTVK